MPFRISGHEQTQAVVRKRNRSRIWALLLFVVSTAANGRGCGFDQLKLRRFNNLRDTFGI